MDEKMSECNPKTDPLNRIIEMICWSISINYSYKYFLLNNIIFSFKFDHKSALRSTHLPNMHKEFG